IERQIRLGHPDFTRIDPYRHDVAWYAPELGRWVRREWRGWYYVPNDRSLSRLEEDWRIWVLTDHQAAPVAGWSRRTRQPARTERFITTASSTAASGIGASETHSTVFQP